MRRKLLILSLLGGVVLATILLLKPLAGLAQQDPNVRQAGGTPVLKPPAPSLPVSQVVLFSSGVGYFQREGEIEGDARVDLSFPARDINDLMKSMVLQDLGGGRISTVSYDSHDPIDRTLKSFALDLTENPTMGQLLNQARGERVEVVMQQSNVTQPGTLAGTIVGMETQQFPSSQAGQGRVEMDCLNLLTAEGLRNLPLVQVQRVRFLNPVLDGELKRALEVLSRSRDTQKKAVSLAFTGEGKRTVRVGYVVENPIWKTSYRLVLDRQGKPFLQGWAAVENPTDEDWTNVRMALVSGRPISFQMDLYSPLYVPRPTVEPELFASLRPQAYEGAMDLIAKVRGPGEWQVNDPNMEPKALNKFQKRWSSAQYSGASKSDGKPPAISAVRARVVTGMGGGGGTPDIQEQVQLLLDRLPSVASGEHIGHSFQYVIDHKVTLPRQKSAMLPIVSQEVKATRVSIYNERVHHKHPLHGLKFQNTSGLHLMQGPVTVFEEGNYAGDGRIMDLQPNEERLLSYAVDLGMEVETGGPSELFPEIEQLLAQPTDKLRGGIDPGTPLEDALEIIGKLHNITIRANRQAFEQVTGEKDIVDKLTVQVLPCRGLGLRTVLQDMLLRIQGPVEVQATYVIHGTHIEVTPIGERTDKTLRTQKLTSVRIHKGILYATSKLQEAVTYNAKNRSEQDRLLLIEHAYRENWRLTRPEKPSERSRDVYRFELKVPAGKNANLEVVEEQTLGNQIAINLAGDDTILLFVQSKVSSPNVKEALRKALDLKARVAETKRQLERLEHQLKAIADDQSRLRQNLEKVPPASAAYKRYLEKFDNQETEIEKLQAQIKESRQSEEGQRKEYEAYLVALNVE